MPCHNLIHCEHLWKPRKKKKKKKKEEKEEEEEEEGKSELLLTQNLILEANQRAPHISQFRRLSTKLANKIPFGIE